MYASILIPTDGSELAGKAVQHGIALAKRIGAKVTVLTVLPPFHTFTTDTQMLEDTPAQYEARMQKHAEKTLGTVVQAAHAAGVPARQSRSRMNTPIGRSSLPRARKAATSLSWPRMAGAASPQSCSAARRSRCSRIPISRYWCIDEPRGMPPQGAPSMRDRHGRGD